MSRAYAAVYIMLFQNPSFFSSQNLIRWAAECWPTAPRQGPARPWALRPVRRSPAPQRQGGRGGPSRVEEALLAERPPRHAPTGVRCGERQYQLAYASPAPYKWSPRASAHVRQREAYSESMSMVVIEALAWYEARTALRCDSLNCAIWRFDSYAPRIPLA